MTEQISTTQQAVDMEKFAAGYEKIDKHTQRFSTGKCWCGAKWSEQGFCEEILRQQLERT